MIRQNADIVDERAVGAAQIDGHERFAFEPQMAVQARDAFFVRAKPVQVDVGNHRLALFRPAQDVFLLAK